MGQFDEKRTSLRHPIEAPIEFDDGRGVTRDFSLSGVYFTTRKAFKAGDYLRFFLDLKYAIPGREVPLECKAYVLRVERKDRLFGVAARIDNIAYQH